MEEFGCILDGGEGGSKVVYLMVGRRGVRLYIGCGEEGSKVVYWMGGR